MLARLKSVYGDSIPPARVPDDWRAKRVLVPAVIRLEREAGLADYEKPGLLRTLEKGFAEFLSSHEISSLDIPELRSKDRSVSQLFGRFLFDQGCAGIAFESSIPPGGTCIALFEGRARLRPGGPKRSLAASFPALRKVCAELDLELS
jgi:hypothetical protein